MALIGRQWWWGVLLAGCGSFQAMFERVPPEEDHEVWRGSGYALRVPRDARVKVSPRELAVDAKDGSWWFDVRLLDRPEDLVPQAAVMAWAEERCLPYRLDQPAEPVDRVWTFGGQCSIGYGRFWMEAVLVDDGDRLRFVGAMGKYGGVHYEALWVQLFETALSLRAGDEPGRIAPAEEIRDAVRTTPFEGSAGLLPVPGGGVFSAKVARHLGARWEGWRDASVPVRFASEVDDEPGSAPPDDASPGQGDPHAPVDREHPDRDPG